MAAQKAPKKRKAETRANAGLDPVKTETKKGRPSTFTKAIGGIICDRIAGGESLRSICKDGNMPGISTVMDWLCENDDPQKYIFRNRYTRARELQADALVEECIEIADDGTNDWIERLDDDEKKKGYLFNGEAVSRSRIRLEQRRWWASKLNAKKYGDKLDMTTNGNPIPAPVIQVMPPSGNQGP